jgi:hypothetical protein
MEIILPDGVVIPADLGRPMRDLRLVHPKVHERWSLLLPVLEHAGFRMFVNETYRPDIRQQWLWAQGRTAEQCKRQGVPPKFAREGAIVTNSSSAKNSAHGWTRAIGVGKVAPAACAIDVVPVGTDGKPWTKDDTWDSWYAFVARPEVKALGLVHFSKPGKKPWDLPHLQLKEWSDKEKRPIFPPGA